MFASAVSVAVTTGLAFRAVDEEERSALVGAADLLATELEESPSDDEVVEEVREMQQRGLRALVQRGARTDGDTSIAVRPERGCAVAGDAVYRVCVPGRPLPRGLRVWVAAPARVEAYRAPFLGAAGLALVLALVLATLGGGAAARWATSPLSRLRDALSASDVNEPATVTLPPASGISEVDAVARAIEGLLARLDVELTRARRFASDAAHELRTPLTKIIGELDLLRESPPEGEALEAELARLHDRVSRMAVLTERLLALATPRSEGAEELVSLAEVVETLHDELGDARLRIEVADDEDGLVRGDRALLAALVRNGVENALKFSTGPVVLRLVRRADELVVQVDDEGPGVAPELRERVFEQLYRDPAARGTSGHGLGLALVDHIAKIHGGRAAFVDGAPGARLEIELPPFAPA